MSVLLALLLAAPASAAPVIKDPPKASKVVVYERITTAQLEAMLVSKGWHVETASRTGTDTFMRVELAGFKVVLVMSDDGKGVATDLHLYAGFQTPKTPTPLVINAWNTGTRFCRAYVDGSGDPVLEADVDLGGGVLEGHILQQLELFGANVRSFAKHVEFTE